MKTRVNRFRRAKYVLSFTVDCVFCGIIVPRIFTTVFQHDRQRITRDEIKSVIVAELRAIGNVRRVVPSSIVFSIYNSDDKRVIFAERLIRPTLSVAA